MGRSRSLSTERNSRAESRVRYFQRMVDVLGGPRRCQTPLPDRIFNGYIPAIRLRKVRKGYSEIVSDNGTQFHSSEFASLCKEFGIKHTFTPPFHPQSNGQVERFVDTFKRAMMKCKGDKNSLEKVLLSYRSTPNSAIDGYSPDQLFLGRKLRTKLALVHPKGQIDQSEKFEKDKFKQHQKDYSAKMAQQFDRNHGTKDTEFLPTDAVLLLNYRLGKSHWLQGTIVERLSNSPTYRVHVPTLGRIVHRHANQLRRRLDFEGNSNWEPPIQERVAIEPNQRTPPRQHAANDQRTPIVADQAQQKAKSPIGVRRSQRVPKPIKRFTPS
ncbi:hypothetical protein niasHS_004914 [Heterodera schachtii]|uniref:Integrase catalytic domain-containing protein n=1 Tax=Heterodera schachtii TaxID=97005 RepID=A0ABD2K050_HETSC